MSLDKALFLQINGLAGSFHFLDEFLKGIANDYFIIISSCLILLALWFGTRARNKREENQKGVICASGSLGIADGIVKICNLFYFRPRPFTELPTNLLFYKPTDSSFPSNSAAVVFALAIGVFFFDKKVGGFLLLLAFLLGFSRIYVGIHYPSDILGGAAVGAVTAFLFFKFIKFLEPWFNWLLKLVRKSYLA